ncbi:MAG: mechanosensitive ion channel family protein [Anaerolineae bacterium]|jgi:MscS family membrane protein
MMKTKVLSRLAWLMLALVLLLAACAGETPQPAPTLTATPQAEETPEAEAPGPPQGEEPAQGEELLAEIVVTRTPQPTSTPDRAAQTVSEFTRATGLAPTSFLGLAAEDWINLVISLVLVLIGYGIGVLLTGVLLRWIARRTSSRIGEAITEAIGPRLKWLVVILVLSFAARRLTFLSAEIKTILGDVFLALGLILTTLILWSLIDLAYDWQHAALKKAGRVDELDPVLILFTRIGRIVLVALSLSILLSYFGINVSAVAAALGIGGLALSLAAQDTLSDAIAGFIILADRPYRVGDRIEIQGAGTWGDVVDIGLRTTRIRTRDNRMIIVPNSMIGKNQIVNYTYPDPRYRIQTHVGVAYGTDIETARRVIVDAVRSLEQVLPDRPVDALYIEMGDSAMIFRVRWWIESYVDTRRVVDRVHTALQEALDAAGIESPYPIQNVNLQVGPETVDRVSRAWAGR